MTRPSALLVPTRAVAGQDEQPYILQVADGKAVRTRVRLGERRGGLVELLGKRSFNSGSHWELPTGEEQIGVTRTAELDDGQPVRARPQPGN